MRRSITWFTWILLTILASSAAADERHAEQIEQFARKLAQLETEDGARAATDELNNLRNRILEARVLLRDDRPQELDRLLRIMHPQSQLITALIELELSRRKAEELRTQADALDEKVNQLKRKKELLEQRLELLRTQARSRMLGGGGAETTTPPTSSAEPAQGPLPAPGAPSAPSTPNP